MNTVLYYFLQFFLGGGVILGMTLLTKHVGPKAASLLYVLPTQFTIAIIFIFLGSSRKSVQDVASSTILSVALLVMFILVFSLLIKKLDFWPSLGIAYAIFFAVGFVYLKFF